MSANSVWLIVISATIGGFISQFITEFIRWMTKPRLRFQTASKIPFVIVAPLLMIPPQSEKQRGFVCEFIIEDGETRNRAESI
jgi:hypothetical protein